MRRPLANALDIELAGGLTEQVTPQAGSARLIERWRRRGVIAAAERHRPAKQSTKGRRRGELVETFLLLSALGGDGLDDFDRVRRDRGPAALPGHALPAASTVRPRPDQFHAREAVAGRPLQGSGIPPERAGLAGLRAVVDHRVRTYCAAAAVPARPFVSRCAAVASSRQAYPQIRGRVFNT